MYGVYGVYDAYNDRRPSWEGKSYLGGHLTNDAGHLISPTMIRFILVQVRGTAYCYAHCCDFRLFRTVKGRLGFPSGMRHLTMMRRSVLFRPSRSQAAKDYLLASHLAAYSRRGASISCSARSETPIEFCRSAWKGFSPRHRLLLDINSTGTTKSSIGAMQACSSVCVLMQTTMNSPI